MQVRRSSCFFMPVGGDGDRKCGRRTEGKPQYATPMCRPWPVVVVVEGGRGSGGQCPQQHMCVPNIGPQTPASSVAFVFFPRTLEDGGGGGGGSVWCQPLCLPLLHRYCSDQRGLQFDICTCGTQAGGMGELPPFGWRMHEGGQRVRASSW